MGRSRGPARRASAGMALLLHAAAAALAVWRAARWWRGAAGGWDARAAAGPAWRVDEHVANVVHNALRGSEQVRVYVYDLPPKFNRWQVARSHQKPAPIRDPYCDENFYSAEVTVHRQLLESKARTTDGEAADLFYVPIYVTCFLINNHPNNLTKTGMFFDEAMQHVMHKHAFYNRSQGRDHVYTFAQGFGARLAGDNWRRWRTGIFLTHNGDLFAEEFAARKDIVIPPDVSHYLTPVFADGARRESAVLARRRFLAHFGGQSFSAAVADHRGSNYSGGVRQFLTQQLAATAGFRITGTRSAHYLDDMRSSMFCLAPEGWHPWSPRPYYGLLLGCVPVVLSERQELAFEDVVPYERLVVWVRPRDVRGLNAALRAVHARDILARVRAMEQLWRVWWYGDGGLALDMILAELARHTYASRPRHHYRAAV